MSNLQVVDEAAATGQAAELLAQAARRMGTLPNSLKAMANSPALLKAYLSMSSALAAGTLSAGVRDRLALTVAQYNGCSYCLSAHTYLGGHVAKVEPEELERARYAKSDDPHIAAVLGLADAIVRARGHVDSEVLDAARASGVTDEEIAEVVGHVALNVLTNYFNTLSGVEIDWPVTVTADVQGVPVAVQMQQLLTGFEVSQALYVIAEMGVATRLLDGPRGVDELARATGADAGALGRIIRFLTPLGVFRTADGQVEITDLGRTLADGPADSVRGLARYWMETHYVPFSGLLHTARSGETGATKVLGKPFFDWVAASPHLSALQNAAMANGGHAARGNLLDVYQLPAGQTIADIGGADGTLLTQLLAKAPESNGIVFDLPSVAAKAGETLRAGGLDHRARVVTGDFFDSVPAANTYVLSHILHDWDDAACARILRNIAKAAAPGAHLVLLEAVIPEGDGPHFSKMIDLTMLAMLGGHERTLVDWRPLLAEGGFRLVRTVSGSGSDTAIEATLN
jgi:uncharacterized peroxidase-related enzyme